MSWRAVLILVVASICWAIPQWKRHRRRQRFDRGRRLTKRVKQARIKHGLRWGPLIIPESSATRHFLAAGTTGSGKSLIQRLLMRDALLRIKDETDARCLIVDAKNDSAAFLQHIGVTCPVYSLNPFETSGEFPIAIAWDIAADITSPARALNLAASLIPAEKGGNNQYFTDAARQVLAGVIESFITHSPYRWTLSDLVYALQSKTRVKELLSRDQTGQEVLDNFFGDERTGYQVFTTIVSRMAYHKPVAAIWQRVDKKLSLREWLTSESILLLGANATSQRALDALNEIIFRVIVEEIDMQGDSNTRRTWIWIDEARLAGPLLNKDLIPTLCVKGRSRGACLVLAFQDIEGLREAAGPRLAHEIIAQCSHKALLRMESPESAQWASQLLGQYETLEIMNSHAIGVNSRSDSQTEHLTKKEATLPSEFYTLPITTPQNGLTGYFIEPSVGAVRSTLSGQKCREVVARRFGMAGDSLSDRDANARLVSWKDPDKLRLSLAKARTKGIPKRNRLQSMLRRVADRASPTNDIALHE